MQVLGFTIRIRHGAAAACLGAAVGLAMPAAFAAETGSGNTQSGVGVQIPDAQNTVGIVAGPPGSASLGAMAQLAAIAGRDSLRIVPIAGKGPVQNISDLLHLKGADAAIAQTDALEFAAKRKLFGPLNEKISYLTTMPKAVFHLIVRDDAIDLKSLSGRKINTGVTGSGFAITANTVLDAAGVTFTPTSLDTATALQALKTGQIDAMVYIDYAPAPLLQRMDEADGLKLMALPLPARMAGDSQLATHYQPAWVQHGDYNGLIRLGSTVETVSVGTALVGYNWPAKSKGHDRLTRLYGALSKQLTQLGAAPYHRSWRTVTLSARLAGWERHRAARQHLVSTDAQNERQQNDELHALRAMFKMQLGAQHAGGGKTSEGPGVGAATE